VKPEKYTIMLIPDDESGSKSYHVSKMVIQFALSLVVLFVIAVTGILLYYIPKISDYSDLKIRLDQFSSERHKVLELTRDLNRLNQMDELVRHSLGTKLDIDDKPIMIDSITGAFSTASNHISFIDNIPSVAPIQGFVSQRSRKAGLFVNKTHHGIDIVAKEGDPILAAASGVVVYSGWNYEFGNMLILYHGDDYFTHYGHNKQNFKKQLDRVIRGEVIGLVGNTGISSGPHLHFEVWKKFRAMDPLNFFPEYQTTDLTSSHE
jgi:murein DD-endopeptidase MepM/ murein hydrolase activator NlpD